MRLGADSVGVGVLFSAVGICCVATFLPTALGAGVIAGVVGFVSGLGLFVVPLAIVRSHRPHPARMARAPGGTAGPDHQGLATVA